MPDEEIRAAVKKTIETRDKREIWDIYLLLEYHTHQKVQLTDEEIRAAVKKIIEMGYECMILRLLQYHIAQKIQLTDEEIRAAVKKIIEMEDGASIISGKGEWMLALNVENILPLLKAYFAKEIQLTDEEIGSAIRKLLCYFSQEAIIRDFNGEQQMIRFIKDYFLKLTEMQVVTFAKKMAPNEMIPFLGNYSQKLGLDRFQCIVEASSPLFICSFWKKYATTLSQKKLIILKKKVIDVERQKLTFILQKRLCKTLPTHLDAFFTFFLQQCLNPAPWKDLRYLLPESDR
jgi:hypothetical protein